MTFNETGHPVTVEGESHTSSVQASDYHIQSQYMGPNYRGIVGNAVSMRASVQGKAIQAKHSTKCS